MVTLVKETGIVAEEMSCGTWMLFEDGQPLSPQCFATKSDAFDYLSHSITEGEDGFWCERHNCDAYECPCAWLHLAEKK